MSASTEKEGYQVLCRYVVSVCSTCVFLSKFLPAPEIPTRRIVVTARPAQPSIEPSENTNDMSWSTFQNPPRPAYPKEVLKHRFLPVGAETPTAGDEDTMEVDMPTPSPPKPSSPAKHKAEDHGESKAKKRKVEGSTKKSKKAKAAA